MPAVMVKRLRCDSSFTRNRVMKFMSASMPLIRLGARFPRSSRLWFVTFESGRPRVRHDRRTRAGSDQILNWIGPASCSKAWNDWLVAREVRG
jgi:hypothetical protein